MGLESAKQGGLGDEAAVVAGPDVGDGAVGELTAEGVELDLAGKSGRVEEELDGYWGCALLQVERICLGDVLEGG